ncbi:MAG: hypothetical protein JNM58_00040 [Xanthomonadaceae bacterium]|nr:hypothetical protein [Xanthomonadaceae bacterium]
MSTNVYAAPVSKTTEAKSRATTWQDKLVASITMAHCVLGIIWNAVVVSRLGFATEFHVSNFVLAAVGVTAAIGWLKQRRWAGYLTLGFY